MIGKRILIGLLCVSLIAGLSLLSGCEQKELTGIARIQDQGQLILATESTYPPFQYMIVEGGQTINAGLDVDMMRRFAEALGVELVIHEMAFESIIPSVQAGTADIGGSFTPTPERAEVIDFSILYYENNNHVIVRSGEGANYPTLDSFQGARLGAQRGTIQETIISSVGGIDVLALPRITSLIQELFTGNIEGIVVDRAVGDTYAAAYSDRVEMAPFEIEGEVGEADGVAMIVAKEQPDLLEALNDFISKGLADGSIDTMYYANLNAAIDQILADLEDE